MVAKYDVKIEFSVHAKRRMDLRTKIYNELNPNFVTTYDEIKDAIDNSIKHLEHNKYGRLTVIHNGIVIVYVVSEIEITDDGTLERNVITVSLICRNINRDKAELELYEVSFNFFINFMIRLNLLREDSILDLRNFLLEDSKKIQIDILDSPIQRKIAFRGLVIQYTCLEIYVSHQNKTIKLKRCLNEFTYIGLEEHNWNEVLINKNKYTETTRVYEMIKRYKRKKKLLKDECNLEWDGEY